MSISLIESNAQRSLALHPDLKRQLEANGIRASIQGSSNGFVLVVQGHDSPVCTYPITEQQVRSMHSSGPASGVRRGYETFVSIVRADFDVPQSYVSAQSAGSRVNMGQYGYRTNNCYSRIYMPFMPPHHMRGWMGGPTHPHSPYFGNMRRINGHLWMGDCHPMIPERAGGYLKPGEIQSGSYGFYYKGGNQQQQQSSVQSSELLDQMEVYVQPNTSQVRPIGETEMTPIPLDMRNYHPISFGDAFKDNGKWIGPKGNDRFSEDNWLASLQSGKNPAASNFDSTTWLKVLNSHGVNIDANTNQMSVYVPLLNKDITYTLTPEEISTITNPSLSSAPMSARLDIINKYIEPDLDTKLTGHILYSNGEAGMLGLGPDAAPKYARGETLTLSDGQQANITDLPGYAAVSQNGQNGGMTQELWDKLRNGDIEKGAIVDGSTLSALDKEKAWFREGKNGREVSVGAIWVEPQYNAEGKPIEGKYQMGAVINGEQVYHEISQKDYNKFLNVDDLQRMRMFSKKFPEVDMKPTVSGWTKFGNGLLNVACGTLGVIGALAGSLAYGDCYYSSMHCGGRPGPGVIYKPGVDDCHTIASRNYAAALSSSALSGHGRGF